MSERRLVASHKIPAEPVDSTMIAFWSRPPSRRHPKSWETGARQTYVDGLVHLPAGHTREVQPHVGSRRPDSNILPSGALHLGSIGRRVEDLIAAEHARVARAVADEHDLLAMPLAKRRQDAEQHVKIISGHWIIVHVGTLNASTKIDDRALATPSRYVLSSCLSGRTPVPGGTAVVEADPRRTTSNGWETHDVVVGHRDLLDADMTAEKAAPLSRNAILYALELISWTQAVGPGSAPPPGRLFGP